MNFRRTDVIFRRIEQLMADGAGYEIASVLAFQEWAESLVDRADERRDIEQEER